jgi:hypothetical protein
MWSPQNLFSSDHQHYRPRSVVWNGTQWAVFFSKEGAGVLDWQDAYAAVYSTDGTLIGGEHHLVSDGDPHDREVYDAAWNGTLYCVVWSDHRTFETQIYSAAVNTNGERIGGPYLISNCSDNCRHPRIASDPSLNNSGVVWMHMNSPEPGPLQYNGLDRDCRPYSAATTLPFGEGSYEDPDIDFSWQHYGIVYQGPPGNEVMFALVSQAGVVTSGPTNVSNSTSNEESPRLAWMDGTWLVL